MREMLRGEAGARGSDDLQGKETQQVNEKSLQKNKMPKLNGVEKEKEWADAKSFK